MDAFRSFSFEFCIHEQNEKLGYCQSNLDNQRSRTKERYIYKRLKKVMSSPDSHGDAKLYLRSASNNNKAIKQTKHKP